jgi:hypothetical protein
MKDLVAERDEGLQEPGLGALDQTLALECVHHLGHAFVAELEAVDTGVAFERVFQRGTGQHRGHVLVTTRRRVAGRTNRFHLRTVTSVERRAEADGRLLDLSKLLVGVAPEVDADKLVNALQGRLLDSMVIIPVARWVGRAAAGTLYRKGQ